MSTSTWDNLSATQRHSLSTLFVQDEARVEKLTINISDMRFDFSKTHLDDAQLALFAQLANEQKLSEQREALFTGEIVNPTEVRAAEHCAERGTGSAAAVSQAKVLQSRMRGLIEVIEAGGFGEIRHILHIGIGGSALGPKLIMDALGREESRFDVRVVSNVDGAALAEAFATMDPQTTWR
jgi:glucose-6-phosphate isomerase